MKVDKKKSSQKIENTNIIKNFIKESVSLVIGKSSENIIDFLDKEKYINEFIIAKKLNITINQTRNLLYKLSEYGMVSSMRKKDRKKGWYTYFWKLETLKALEFLKDNVDKRIKQILQQIESRETKRFYVCERCNIEFNEENALSYDFVCSECGNVFTVKDNSKVLKELKKNLDKYNKEMEEINEEIKKDKEILDKKKLKEMRKEEKINEKKKEEKRKERQKIREKEKKLKNKFAKPIKNKKKTKKSAKKTKKKSKSRKNR